MSDTPRTDEQINGKPCTRFEVLAGDSLRNASVPSEFARQLERELNAANDRIKRLESGDAALNYSIGLDLQKENDALKQRIKRLEEELMDMKNKHAVLVADVALYEDRGERIKRLEEALEGTVKRIVDLANSGDAGFWNPEEESVIIAARAALKKEDKL